MVKTEVLVVEVVLIQVLTHFSCHDHDCDSDRCDHGHDGCGGWIGGCGGWIGGCGGCEYYLQTVIDDDDVSDSMDNHDGLFVCE